ncbi:hypothetical protein ACOMHN_010312 [Nucella lapillus]
MKMYVQTDRQEQQEGPQYPRQSLGRLHPQTEPEQTQQAHLETGSLLSQPTATVSVTDVLGAAGAASIDCYRCTSINGANEACEDPFKTDLSTVDLIDRDCQYGYFSSTHCIKLKGVKEDGTKILVRHCSNSDWGKNCGDIRYIHSEDDEERIQGCLTTCNFDGCNSAPSRLAPSPLLLLLLGVVGGGVPWLLRGLPPPLRQ